MKNEKKKKEIYACDFETTVYEGQERTDVWSAAYAKLFSDEEGVIMHSIDEFIEWLFSLNNPILYFHNLKFDGEFIQYWLLKHGFSFVHEKGNKLYNKEFNSVISDMGVWYSLTIKYKGKVYEIRDSLKLLPFSLKRIGEAFCKKHKKLEMEYEGYRYPGCNITEEEKAYILEDVYVLREALEFMYDSGMSKLTIGQCCLSEYKKKWDKEDYKALFPNLYLDSLPDFIIGYNSIGDYIRSFYKGAVCMVKPGLEGKDIYGGRVFDVNSLYSSVMHSKSGNYYPVGKPKFFSGKDTV